MRRSSRRGFTLIEILLVIGIIAMLAAFVVPSFRETGEDAKVRATRAMINGRGELATQIELFQTHVGRYPRELNELYEKPTDEREASTWAGPYVTDADSFRDGWNNELHYREPGTVNVDRYDLWSNGRDQQEGTEDDIANYKKS